MPATFSPSPVPAAAGRPDFPWWNGAGRTTPTWSRPSEQLRELVAKVVTRLAHRKPLKPATWSRNRGLNRLTILLDALELTPNRPSHE